MNIIFVTQAWDTASRLSGTGIYRCLIPSQALQLAGHNAVIVPELISEPSGELKGLDWDGQVYSGADVIIHTGVSSSDLVMAIPRAQKFGQTIIASLDDWVLGLTATNPGRTGLTKGDTHVRHLLASFHRSDGAIFSTPYLSHLFKDKINKSAVIRNMISDVKDWTPRIQSKDAVKFGWAGFTKARTSDLAILRGVAHPFQAQHDCMFVHLGHDPNNISLAEMINVPVICEPELPYRVYQKTLGLTMDVGLVPLTDTKFNRSKSWLKRLEYGACKIPSIASDLPEQVAWSKEGAKRNRPVDWTREFERMMSVDYRLERAEATFKLAVANQVSTRGHEWEQVLAKWVG